ncbi:flagellar hook-length control protein FliK [Jannaschia formosa]|uniref:flagellar hook-length control protein FliK n=1 Tax=Jannaschia formosa TaxID=2259592 RepID=UPI000E1BCABA|nr:flagellar hook-length control protein FliK [Jannaschia formosa]TFL19342.1 flagellar hook-length control protein FliK [Jannaschia formosa]
MTGIMDAERAAFWAELAAAAPEFGIEGGTGQEREIGIACGGRLRIKMSLSQDRTSVYLVARSEPAREFVQRNLPELARGLRTSVGEATGEAALGRWFRKDNRKACVTVRRQWPEAIRWLRAQHATFVRAVEGLT